MNKVSKTILITSIAVFGASVFLISSTFAQTNDNLVVQFEPNPLFTGTNFLPGQNATGTARVTNNSGQPQRIATEAINYPGFPNPDNIPAADLSRALSIIIREKDGSDLYGGTSLTGEKTLFDFYQKGETYLSDLPTGDTKKYEYEIAFPLAKENEWQGATTTFDILIGFQGTGGQVSPGTPPSGGGVPGLTIQHERDFYIGTTTAKITWLTSYNSTSRVIYDTVAGVFNLNNLPNYGYTFSTVEQDTPAAINGTTSHEVWLTDLQPGTTYYFRCVSHGSFAVSMEHSFTTLGTKTLTPVVAGEETFVYEGTGLGPAGAGEAVPGEMAEGAVGEETAVGEEESGTGLEKLLAAIGSLFGSENLWWLLIILALILIIFFFLSRKKKKKE